ncbi:MAG: hypothetical protein HUU06_03860 [Planctomycetaceae bacterium]|nr:hypothetical protein [Planctomycetaceae bacterium]
MAASSGFVGKGTVIKRGDGAGPEVFTAVAEVRDISGYEMLLKLAEASHLTSDDGMEERKAAMKDISPITFSANLIPTNTTVGIDTTTGIGLDWKNGTLRNFQLVLSDAGAAVIQFAAYVTKLAITGINKDNMVQVSIELTPQGLPTVTL